MSTIDDFTGIPGTISDDAKKIRWLFVRKVTPPGCGPAREYRAQRSDGWLRALVSQDPAGRDGKLLWHVSVSFKPDFGRESRLPTWDELKTACYRLVQADVPFILIFPRSSAPYVNIHNTCLHLYESDQEIDL